jgi:hypothetical protein
MMTEITTRWCATLRSHRRAWRPGDGGSGREIISSVYRYANDRGHGLFNPAADIKPSSIAMFKPRDRTLHRKRSDILPRAG